MNKMIPLTSLLSSKIAQFGLVSLIAFGGGAYLHHKLEKPITTTTIVHDIQQVKVEIPTLTTKIVDNIISDPKQQAAIKLLMKENDELKLKVTQLSSTVATNQTTGGTSQGGTITSPTQVQGNTPSMGQSKTSSHYSDFQLAADYSTNSFSYKLNQSFIIESSIGKDSKGDPIGITRLWQDTPTGLLPIPAKTTIIQAAPNPSRWFLSPRIQGGINIDQDKSTSGFVGLQVVKHGTSRDPKDIRFSVGTIGARISKLGTTPLLVPLSFNLGALPNQPFSNVWVSPGIDLNKKLSLVISATF